jgi:phage minor structural protein
MTTLIDSYSEVNADDSQWLDTLGTEGVGQSFTGTGIYLHSCKFYINKTGLPATFAYAKIYAHKGTYGTNGTPVSIALAISDPLPVEDLAETPALVLFTFSGANRIWLENGTKYVLTIEYYGANGSNYIEVWNDESSPTHGGNFCYKIYGDSWASDFSEDLIFYLYGTAELTSPDVVTAINLITGTREREINGMWSAKFICPADSNIAEGSHVDIPLKTPEDGYNYEEYIVNALEKIEEDSKYYYSVEAYHNFTELGKLHLEPFYRTDTIAGHFAFILDGCRWTAGGCDIDETIILSISKAQSRLYCLNLLAEKCSGELYWHSKTRVADLLREIGSVTGIHLRTDKNAKSIKVKTDFTEVYTRIIPYGADNYEPNSIEIDYMEDETLYTASGAGTKEASTIIKFQGSQAIKFNASVLNETFIRDLGAGGVINLSDYLKIKLDIYSEVDNAAGFRFAVNEVNDAGLWTEIYVDTGALEAGCKKPIELDLSAVLYLEINAIRYIGFKNLTNGAISVIVDNIRAFDDVSYIDSANRGIYDTDKEYIYHHNAKYEKLEHEILIYPEADTHVSEGSPTANKGDQNNLKIRDNSGSDFIALLKFPLTQVPSGVTITSAILTLRVIATDFTSGGTADIQKADRAFGELTGTWNNKPGSAGNVATLDGNSVGDKNIDILTLFDDWLDGTVINHGIRIQLNIADVNKIIRLSSREGSNPPVIKVKFTTENNPTAVIIADAIKRLAEIDVPKTYISGKLADLSQIMEDTWENEIIGLGDTLRAYNKNMNLNTGVRVLSLKENLVDPSDLFLELVNKAYTLVDLEVKRARQLSYFMPFENDIISGNANTIEEGYFGGKVNV